MKTDSEDQLTNFHKRSVFVWSVWMVSYLSGMILSMQWYVAEQHEEEQLFKAILDKIELIGTDGNSLFFFDKEIGNMHLIELIAK